MLGTAALMEEFYCCIMHACRAALMTARTIVLKGACVSMGISSMHCTFRYVHAYIRSFTCVWEGKKSLLEITKTCKEPGRRQGAKSKNVVRLACFLLNVFFEFFCLVHFIDILVVVWIAFYAIVICWWCVFFTILWSCMWNHSIGIPILVFGQYLLSFS